MKSNRLGFAGLASLLLLTTAGAVPTSPGPVRTRTVLEKGMDADFILNTYGKPSKIQQLAGSEVKAEKWFYYRNIGETTTQKVASQYEVGTQIPDPFKFETGSPNPAHYTVAEYRLEHVVAYQVTALLMVNGKLELGKQWTEREVKYTN